jgi:hypothetical protein
MQPPKRVPHVSLLRHGFAERQPRHPSQGFLESEGPDFSRTNKYTHLILFRPAPHPDTLKPMATTPIPAIPVSDHILATLRQHAPELQAAGVAHLRLFGSVARGEATPPPTSTSSPTSSPASASASSPSVVWKFVSPTCWVPRSK